jgi:hypothetical protein
MPESIRTREDEKNPPIERDELPLSTDRLSQNAVVPTDEEELLLQNAPVPVLSWDQFSRLGLDRVKKPNPTRTDSMRSSKREREIISRKILPLWAPFSGVVRWGILPLYLLLLLPPLERGDCPSSGPQHYDLASNRQSNLPRYRRYTLFLLSLTKAPFQKRNAHLRFGQPNTKYSFTRSGVSPGTIEDSAPNDSPQRSRLQEWSPGGGKAAQCSAQEISWGNTHPLPSRSPKLPP